MERVNRPLASPDGASTSPASSAEELVAALPGIVWEADGTDYRMAYVSPRARDLLGHDPSEWVRTPDFWEAHLHPGDRELAVGAVDRAVAGLESTTLEYRFRAADGSYRVFQDVIRVIERPDGHRHIVGFMVDRTDVAGVEGERRLLAAAVDAAQEQVAIFDARGRAEYVNPAAAVAGAPEDDRAADPSISLLGDASDEAAIAALASQQAWHGDIASRGPDGRRRVAEASITPVADPVTGERHWVRVSRDVTEERAARQAQARLATIIQSAADAAYANDLDGTVLAWNAAAERIYGWRSEEVLGRRIYDLVERENHSRIAAWLHSVGQGETLGPLDMEQVGRDGRRLTLSVTAAPVRDETGRVTAVATIARDVSEERRAAAERAELEAQLFQAQKLEAVGRLAGGIAHDFNNMLTAILGYAGLVAANLEGEDLAAQREVLHAAERAADLTGRLLAFSRPTASDPRPVYLDEALGDAMGMLRRLVPERIGLQFRPGAKAYVVATPVEIEQVLMNLVINAADATPASGDIAISTSIAEGPVPGAPPSPLGFVRLRVADRGAGMDAETRLRIFDPFFSTKGFGDGTGLGLSTVHGIVTRAGGTIRVRSREGRGSTFDVFLPVAAAPEPAHDAEAKSAVAGSGRVLVVDDSEVVGRLASRVLQMAGYSVDIETDPRAVVSRGAAGYDVVVTDVVMPGLSGPDMVDALGLGIPVVFLSGYAAELEPSDLGARPDRAFVAKPFSGPELLGAVRAVMLAAKAAGGGHAP